MKVSGPGGPFQPSGPRRPASSSGVFNAGSAGAASASAAPTRAGGMSGVTSLDALLALQDVEGPIERRRKAVRRAGRILDVLDEVKLALLDEGGSAASPASLERLATAVQIERGRTHDARLDGVLDEIETRAAVELAKWEMARTD